MILVLFADEGEHQRKIMICDYETNERRKTMATPAKPAPKKPAPAPAKPAGKK